MLNVYVLEKYRINMLNNDFIPVVKKSRLILKKYIYKIWYLFAIDIIDTQVARRGRQYYRNPPYKVKRIKLAHRHQRPTRPNTIRTIRTYKKNHLQKRNPSIKLVMSN